LPQIHPGGPDRGGVRRVVLIPTLLGAIQFNSSVVAAAVAAVLGGIVAAGSKRSTAKEALRELTILEAKRATLIAALSSTSGVCLNA
jgi:hypothetical protein